HARHRPLCRDQSSAERSVSLETMVYRLVCPGSPALLRRDAAGATLDPQDRKTRRDGSDQRRRGHRKAGRVVTISPHERAPLMNDVLVPVSPGELLDKITILRIKSARITDPAKVGNVRLELGLLENTWRDSGCAEARIAAEERALHDVNERL